MNLMKIQVSMTLQTDIHPYMVYWTDTTSNLAYYTDPSSYISVRMMRDQIYGPALCSRPHRLL